MASFGCPVSPGTEESAQFEMLEIKYLDMSTAYICGMYEMLDSKLWFGLFLLQSVTRTKTQTNHTKMEFTGSQNGLGNVDKRICSVLV